MRTERTDLSRKRARHADPEAGRAPVADVAGRAVARVVPGRRVAARQGRAARVARGPRAAAIAAPVGLTGAAQIEAAASAGGPTTARTVADPLAR
jgi:hypothetical protein